MPKSLDLKSLFTDLEYTIFGTEAHKAFAKCLPQVDGITTVLEPGCGSGKFGLMFALLGCEVIMLDIDPEVIRYARRLRGALNELNGSPLATQIRVGNIHKLRFADNSFDYVYNEGVSQHWVDEKLRQGSIDEMVRVSRNMVAIMGNNGLNPTEKEADEKVNFGYKGMPPKRKCFTPEELEMRMRKAGLKNVHVEAVLPGDIKNCYLIIGYGRK